MEDKAGWKQKAACDICAIHCSSAYQLCEHVVGHKHRMNAMRVSPDCLPHMYKLQYFFDTYMKQDPLVGLEYVEEIPEAKGFNYQYNCLLCGFHGNRKPAYLHITGSDHIMNYIDKHHPDFSVNRAMYPQKSKYVKALQEAAAKVYEVNGRKKITEIVVDSNANPTLTKATTPVSDPKPTIPETNAASSDRNGDLNNKQETIVRKSDGGQEEQLSEFKGNGDFLDYLKKFEIRSDEDAWAVRRIVQNCTLALERFRQEQAQQSRGGGEAPAPACRTDNRDTNVVAPTPQPQNDVTALFFNSIKNMEQSEVMGILHNIAATNPAFRGIDVPNVMKYLQATGRLKTS